MNMPYKEIPIIALSCNLVVVTGSAFHFIRYKQVNLKFILPFVITSIPFAYFAGLISVEKKYFTIILGICLLTAGVRMLVRRNDNYEQTKGPSIFLSSIIGSILGFLSGLVGIGGGIFLSPLMYNFKWAKPKEISALCCLFIFFNSIAGLIGQLQKVDSFETINSYWGLIIAVFIGGQLGSLISINKLKPRYVELLTAILVTLLSLRVLFFS